MGRATAPLRGRPAIGATPQPGTSDNACHGTSCKRCAYGRTPRSRSVRRGRRAPPCGSARLRSSPSTGRGSDGRGWARGTRDRARGGCPRPPVPVEPWATALSRRRLLSVSLRLPVARRAQARERALDLGDESCRHAGVASRRVELVVSKQRLNQPNVRAVLEQMGCEGMAQRMKGDRLAQPRRFRRLLEQPAELARRRRLTVNAPGKQPPLFRRNAAVAPHRPCLPLLPHRGEESGLYLLRTGQLVLRR